MADFLDLGELTVGDFAPGGSGEAVTRRRYGATVTLNHHRVAPAPEDTPELRIFCPPTAGSTDRRPEGTHRSASLVFYAQDEWRTDDEATGARGDDLVRADGSVWHVERVADYRAAAGFLEAEAVLVRRAGP